tara:strand:+ start:1688 stop:3277 length:1590 start_codon:yes stop_codon:yes gene_type:complete
MANKRQIAEQVQRIVNGGSNSDDSKVTLREVMALVEQERDAMIKKHIMESSVVGEHEIPAGFLSKIKAQVYTDSDYGVGGSFMGRQYASIGSVLNLPNDAAIYSVCTHPTDLENTGSLRSDERQLIIDNFTAINTSTPSVVYIQLKNKTGTEDVGTKFVFSFKHGYDANTLKDYSFTFTYKNPSDRRESDKVNQNSLNPQVLLMSLNNNKDFQDFLKVNKLKFTWADEGTYWRLNFTSHYSSQYFGAAESNNFSIRSILTNKTVVDWDTSGLVITSSYSQAGGQNYPTLGFGIKIEYSKNKRLKDLGADIHNIKEKGSTSLTTYIELTEDDIRVDGDGGYETITGNTLVQMWINKYQGLLKTYGVIVESRDGKHFIREQSNNGGFDSVEFQGMTGITGSITISTVGSEEIKQFAEDANYITGIDCYTRMSNPGQFSNMYDNAILLSGRKFWYRQGKRIYLYNSNHATFTGSTLRLNVLAIKASKDINDVTEEFAVPQEYVPEMIKSLVATFSIMRQAQEDLVNDNIDIT